MVMRQSLMWCREYLLEYQRRKLETGGDEFTKNLKNLYQHCQPHFFIFPVETKL